MSAIRLKVKLAEGEHDLGASKFLGKPVLPDELIDEFDQSVLFLLQLNLEELKDLDTENRLPHEGYLYFFLDTSDGIYDMKPIVRYYPGYPVNVVDDFNSNVPEFEDYIDEYLVEFEPVEDDADGIKLFGVPNDWNYDAEPDPLLLQFDPLASDMGIFNVLDGFLYFFFNKKNPQNFKKVTLKEEYS